MSELKFARVFKDHAILQRNKEIHIWGFAAPSEAVSVGFAGKTYECVADGDGRFDVTIPPMREGGPYSLTASCTGQKVASSDIMIGDIIIICGQSNMELPMNMVRESYPHEWNGPFDSGIRTFKVTENGVFGKPLTDVETGDWKILSKESIDDYSAVGYFTAKHLRQKDDVAVGIVNLTLGGVIMEAFMGNDALAGFDEQLAEAKKFEDDEYRLKVLADNEKNEAKWLADLDAKDIGIRDHFEDGVKIIGSDKCIALPDFFSDTELAGFIGSLWIARTFTVPKEYVGKKAVLYFGAITDRDCCYINGQFIGTTDNSYPPRRYTIPEGLIKAGENTIVFRVEVEKGFGRVTPGKLYAVVFDEGVRVTDGFNESMTGAGHIEPLSGIWKYIIGAKCERSIDTVFVNWKPTALYNGLLAPLAGLSVKAFAYYQGESNCGKAEEYVKLTHRFVEQIRGMWGDIPYITVQLPEFNARMEEISFDHGVGWRGIMAAQESCRDIRDYHLIKAYGYGELNDIHPQRKEPIGRSIAEVIASIV